jgi:hypothetical protein
MTGRVLIVDDIIVLDSKEASPMKGYGEAAALIAAFSGNALNHEIERLEKKAFRPTKKCLNPECDKEHTHNNSWCSAECCRTWRANER